MTPSHPFCWNNEIFQLSSDRCIFWESEKALLLADLHIGKTGHFRKSGIAVPQRVYTEDLQRLFNLIFFFKAEQLIVVGDLSHSHSNKELDLFRKWRWDLSSLHIHLVKGNHDILEEDWYRQAGIEVHPKSFTKSDFSFLHNPEDLSGEGNHDMHYFSGHLHPGIVLHGMGKQSLRFPCFHFSRRSCTLPAFSRFTGLSKIEQKEGDEVFAIVEKSLLRIA